MCIYVLVLKLIWCCLWAHHGIIRSLNIIQPPPGEPAKADQIPICAQMASSVLSWAKAILKLSTTSPVLLMAPLSLLPQQDEGLSDRHQAAKPLNPTCAGKLLALKPTFPHPVTSHLFLASFLLKDSATWSSQGTVSTCRTALLGGLRQLNDEGDRIF